MVACANSEEEVWETLRKDVFYSSGEVVREYLSVPGWLVNAAPGRVVGPREDHCYAGVHGNSESQLR